MMSMEKREDLWTSTDKVYHVIFCFSLTVVFTLLISRTPFHFVRRRSLFIASSLSLLAGAAKEFSDYLGFFRSSGASAKDAFADILGVLIACFLVSIIKFISPNSKFDYPKPPLSLV
ncbi:hypothetical protein SOVF_069560 [Spinacia oleracea]|nr:hypothetical protein SOVF_069560 [Spinacia oleracea]